MSDPRVSENNLLDASANCLNCSEDFFLHSALCKPNIVLNLLRGNLTDERRFVLKVTQQAGNIGKNNQLFRLDGRSQDGGGAIAVDVDSVAFITDSRRRQHGSEAMVQQQVKQLRIDSLDFSCEIVPQHFLSAVFDDGDGRLPGPLPDTTIHA